LSGVLLLLASVLSAEESRPPCVYLLFSKPQPSSRKKFEAAVERAFGKDNLDKDAKAALRKSYRWGEAPSLIDLPLDCRLELQVSRKPFDEPDLPKHKAWISLRALNRDSVDADYRRICRILACYVEGNKRCIGIGVPEYRKLIFFMPTAERFEERLATYAAEMRMRDPLVALGLKEKPKKEPGPDVPRPEVTEVKKKASKRAQARWNDFILAWNADDRLVRNYWAMVRYHGPEPVATTMVRIKNARNGQLYGWCSLDKAIITIRVEDVVDWWYYDKDGNCFGKFIEQVASGK